MKTKRVLVLLFCFMLSFFLFNFNGYGFLPALTGDVDGNGVVSYDDALLIYNYVSGFSDISTDQLKAADINGDGEVTISDAAQVFHYLNGVLSELPYDGSIGSRLVIASLPDKIVYNQGEQFSSKGLRLELVYENGFTETVNDYQVSGFSASPGVKIIILSYNGGQAAFTVTVYPKKVEDLIITKLPDKTEYWLYDAADHTGISVTAVYSDGSRAVVYDYTVGVCDMETAGIKKVNIVYRSFITSFEITVKDHMVTEPGERLAFIDIDGNNLRLRALPSLDGKELGLLARGREVIVTGSKIGEWYPVRGMTNEGTVMEGYCHDSGISFK